MSEPTRDKLGRIRALLDNAESYAAQGNCETAEIYRNKAIELMAAHGIEEAMLSAKEDRKENPIRRNINLSKPYQVDKASLLYRIARAMGVRSIRIDGASHLFSVLVGFSNDVARVEALYTSLLVQAFGELARTPTPQHVSTLSFRKSWLIGFTRTVTQRITESERRAQGDYEKSTGTNTELVLASREQQVEAEYQEMFPRAKKIRGRYANSNAGYGAGEAAGKRADIGNKRFQSTTKSISK